MTSPEAVDLKVDGVDDLKKDADVRAWRRHKIARGESQVVEHFSKNFHIAHE